MGCYGQLVVGPAGAGKSTYCSVMNEHFLALEKNVYFINLDPAAKRFDYPVSIDIRDLVTLEEVSYEFEIGPNGSLIYCMEFLEENIEGWFAEEISGYGEGDFLIIDCPGQIELFTHISAIRTLLNYLQEKGWQICIVYLLDSHFITDPPKLISGAMQAMSAVILFEAPSLVIMTKMDLCPNKSDIEHLMSLDRNMFVAGLTERMESQFGKMSQAISSVLEDYSNISFSPLDITQHESIARIQMQIEMALGFEGDEKI
jgi:hypothetical protein